MLHRCTHFTLYVYSFTMWIDNHIVTYTTVINGFNYPNKSLRWTLLLAQFHRRETQASSDERVVHSYLASTEFCLDLNVCSLALRPVYKDLSSLLTGPHYRWKEYYTQVLSYTHTKKSLSYASNCHYKATASHSHPTKHKHTQIIFRPTSKSRICFLPETQIIRTPSCFLQRRMMRGRGRGIR